MLMSQNNYEFRKELLQVHKPGLRDAAATPTRGELVLADGVTVVAPADADIIVQTAAKDFADYLLTSMDVSAFVKFGQVSAKLAKNQKVLLSVEPEADLGKATGYSGFQLEIGKDILVRGHDARGVAQGLYWLEDLMSTRHAPFLKKGCIQRRPIVERRLVHSGYGLDDFPDAHLAAIAHAGMDCIMVYCGGVNKNHLGHADFNTLVHRAAKYGIDVYIYSMLEAKMHPEDAGAAAYYDGLYGSVFKACPGLKGVILVGESVEFPSKDPHTSGKRRLDNFVENIPTGKVSPGWWPCYDYAQWVTMVRDSIRKYVPDADIVFWTYNWGRQPVEKRLALINSLPTDISLQATFEMNEPKMFGNARGYCTDYTLSFAGPGYYFKTEAEAAKKRGIRMYTMANTAGLTWDYGVIPYEPMPYQWLKRYKAIIEAHNNYGLCGIMEGHHYGLWPSFISDLTKKAYFDRENSLEQSLTDVLAKHFGPQNVQGLKKAMRLWSKGITYTVPSIEHQYGPFRIGPAYPLNLDRKLLPPVTPHAVHATGIFTPEYTARNNGFAALSSVRMPEEVKSLKTMLKLYKEGIAVAKAECQMNPAVEKLLGLMEFWCIGIQTGLNVKDWYIYCQQLKLETSPKKIDVLLEKMEALAKAEIANAEAAIPLVQADSRLGWEPSMEYQADEARIRWKIRQVNYMLDVEMGYLRKCRKFSD